MLALLTGCAPPEQERVVARVNGMPIVAQEIDLALEHRGPPSGVSGNGRSTRRHLLEKLVMEELLAQQFRRTTPGSAAVDKTVVNATRRDVLAQRFIAGVVDKVAPPTVAEIRSYYRDNPFMFAQRQVFELRQLDISAPGAQERELRTRLAAAASLDELVEWLRSKNLRFVVSLAERGSDEIALELGSRLRQMRRGQVALLPSQAGFRIIELVGSRTSPVDEATAWPMIERRLLVERQAAAVDAEILALSRRAAITFAEDETREAPATLAAKPGGNQSWFSVLSRDAR
jgi:EpsD family peptidyl-prolyl cis-trans isomerase